MSAWVGNLEIPHVASWTLLPEAAILDSVAEEEDCCKRQGATLAICPRYCYSVCVFVPRLMESKHETPDCCLKRPGLRAWVPSSYPFVTLTVRSPLSTDGSTT